jgi:hypothetical protein
MDSNYMTFWKRKNYTDTVKRSVSEKSEKNVGVKEGGIGRAPGIFKTMRLFCVTLQWSTHHIIH